MPQKLYFAVRIIRDEPDHFFKMNSLPQEIYKHPVQQSHHHLL